MRTSSTFRRNTRKKFVRNRCRELLLSQQFGHFTAHNRRVRVSKGSNRKSFALKVFSILQFKITAAIFSKGRCQHFQKGNSLGEFLKAFDQVNEVSQIPSSKPNFVIGFTKAKDELFSPCYEDIVEHLNKQIRLRSGLKRTRLASFP